ncbi:hypothetical protein OAM69_02490 [bacterium]|nr:hypothetical protein [bacterium]
MQLRRFTAESTPAALGAVRKALGDDAIILANRKIGDQIEIIATGQMDDAQSLAEISVDTDARPIEPQRESATAGPDVMNGVVVGAERASANLLAGTAQHEFNGESGATSFDELTDALDAAEHTGPTNVASNAVHAYNAEVLKYEEQVNRESCEQQRASHVTSGQKANAGVRFIDSAEHINTGTITNPSPRPSVAGGDSRSVLEEVKGLSSDLYDAMVRHNQQLTETLEQQNAMIDRYFKGLEVNLWGKNSPNRRRHLQHLIALGLGAELAVQLVERADPDLSVEAASRQSFALLKSTLPIGVDKTFTVPGITIMSGAPGAGKTTALMKIAMQHVKENGSDSIVVICADTRRIGAFEELQAYGRLLGVPTVHAHDSMELDSLLGAFTRKQLILIDHTLPDDEDAVDIPQRLLKPKQADTVRQLLVLSATSQSSTIEALIRQHCIGRSMQCVLTHLDASARLGELFNAIIRHHLPIAYWSDTASVQKPLQKAEASVLIATAVAMTRRLTLTADDDWLMRLIQPADELISTPVFTTEKNEVSAC